jgi:hypothetical protein
MRITDIGAFYVRPRGVRVPLTRVKSKPKRGQYVLDEAKAQYTTSRADMKRRIEYIYRVIA